MIRRRILLRVRILLRAAREDSVMVPIPIKELRALRGDAKGLFGPSTTPIKWWTPCAKQFCAAKSAVLIDWHSAVGSSRKK